MKNLGRVLILIFFMHSILFADVKIDVKTPAIYKGDMASFSISATGESVKFPQIRSIGGYEIINRSNASSYSNINGKVTNKKSTTYMFYPQKDVVIPPFEVEIDGKVYKTKESKISVLKPTKSKNTDEFVLELKANKSKIRVGESVKLTLIYKQKIGSQVSNVGVSKMKLDNFWIKQLGDVEKSSENEYIVQKINYIAFAQKSGKYTLPAMQADIAQVVKVKANNPFNDPIFDMLSNNIKHKKIYSNSLKFDVLPLGKNLEVYGDYTLNVSVDKQEVNANEPVNMTINISGTGNIDDIKKFNIELPNAVVYADEPKIETGVKNGKYGGNFSQKIAIISQKEYTIKAISFSYFDAITKKIKTIKSTPIKINVNHLSTSSNTTPKLLSGKKVQPKVQKVVVVKNDRWYVKYIMLVVGFVLGAFFFFGYEKVKNQRGKSDDEMVQKIKKTRNDRELFELLLPYSKKDEFVKSTLAKLEENIYSKSSHTIDKKRLMEIFDEL